MIDLMSMHNFSWKLAREAERLQVFYLMVRALSTCRQCHIQHQSQCGLILLFHNMINYMTSLLNKKKNKIYQIKIFQICYKYKIYVKHSNNNVIKILWMNYAQYARIWIKNNVTQPIIVFGTILRGNNYAKESLQNIV